MINGAINQTLSRTVLTSATVFFVILCLFILGGSVIHDFSFAMLIGVVTGTYSSIFVASPILIEFEALRKKKLLKPAARRTAQIDSTPPARRTAQADAGSSAKRTAQADAGAPAGAQPDSGPPPKRAPQADDEAPAKRTAPAGNARPARNTKKSRKSHAGKGDAPKKARQ
jgi:hypothetical protein